MKVRSTIRMLTLAGAATAFTIPGTVMATTFGEWSASSGTVTGCVTGATCTVLVSEDGFLQQQVEVDGKTYFQTVVIPTGVTGDEDTLDFATETFVEQAAGGAGNGVMSRLNVNDLDGDGNGMTTRADVETGNFAGSGAGILINQAITDDNGSSGTGVAENDDFSFSLLLDRNLATDGAVTGTDLQLAQDVGLDTTTSQTGAYDKASFALRRMDGDQNTVAGDATLPAGQGSTTTGGGTADWRTGEDVIVTWVGQRINLGTLGMQYAGYQSIENLDTAFGGGAGTQEIDTFDFGDSDAGPWDWGASSDLETSFGTAPSL